MALIWQFQKVGRIQRFRCAILRHVFRRLH